MDKRISAASAAFGLTTTLVGVAISVTARTTRRECKMDGP
jgi:hypothetical protein